MSEEGTFQQVGESEQAMYGPRVLLVCGYRVEEHPLFLNFVKNTLGEIPMVFVSTENKDKKLAELIAMPHETGSGETSELRRAVIMSGLTEAEFHRLINTYRSGKLPAQLWATLTPMSEKWTIAALLEELAEEQAEMRKMMQERRKAQNQSNDETK